jgi:hypothetical protein
MGVKRQLTKLFVPQLSSHHAMAEQIKYICNFLQAAAQRGRGRGEAVDIPCCIKNQLFGIPRKGFRGSGTRPLLDAELKN